MRKGTVHNSTSAAHASAGPPLEARSVPSANAPISMPARERPAGAAVLAPADLQRGGRERIRVAHVLPWPAVGGIEVATLRIARAARERGIESVAFCPGLESPIARQFAAENFEIASYRRVEPSVRRPLRFLQNSLWFAAEFRRRRIDLVHCSDILGAYYAGLGGRLARLPVLSHVRTRYDELPVREQRFLRPVQHFAFVSRDTWDRFSIPVPEHRATVVYDGIEVDRRGDGEEDRRDICDEFAIPSEATIVGMIARVAPQKDYITLIRAAARLVESRQDIRFLIVGENAAVESYRVHFAEVQHAIAAAGLERFFIFTGFRADVPRFMRALDIFVLSTHAEGLPLVILEAMAHGKPVVATNVDGVPEVVVDGRTGLLHPHQDDRALADALGSLLEDPQRAAQMGEAGRAHVRLHFSERSFGDAVERLYRTLLAGRQVEQGAAIVRDG